MIELHHSLLSLEIKKSLEVFFNFNKNYFEGMSDPQNLIKGDLENLATTHGVLNYYV